MIQLRKNPFSETSIDIPFIEGENGKQLIERTLSSNGFELSDNVVFHFNLVVNGHIVDRDLWAYVIIKEEDNVLIGPRVTRGAGGQLFKQLALIVIAVVAAALGQEYVTAGAITAMGAAAGVAAVTIGSTLILNALIPPPGLGGSGLGSTGASFEGSQMYTITSQSNNAKKFGYVPKVYGTHRIFPLVVANPYTEIEADPSTGTLVQFFYAIYDFGFGPLDISDIKIGDTSITEYGDAEYRLVDLNKPAVAEGYWDEKLEKDFKFYKGDVERDGSSVALDKNQSDTAAHEDDYRVVRNASDKVNGNDQEISLDFVAPQGLIAYATNGTAFERNIDLMVEFSKVGENVWKAYNDPDYVYGFTIAGGSTVISDKFATLPPFNGYENTIGYTQLSVTNLYQYGGTVDFTFGKLNSTQYIDHDNNINTPPIKIKGARVEIFGIPAGTKKLILKNGDATTRDMIVFRGTTLGKVIGVEPHPTLADFSLVELDVATSVTYSMFEVRRYLVETLEQGPKGAVNNLYWLEEGEIISNLFQDNKVTVKHLSEGIARLAANNTQQVYFTLKFKPKEISAFKVRVTRKSSSSVRDFKVVDKLTLVSLSTRFDRVPILTKNRHVFLEVRIRATNQLNGAIQNLSAVAESILDVYDSNTGTWVKKKTNNPAWVFCDMLTGKVNKRAVSKDRIHLPTITEWADFCDAVPTPPPSQSFVQKRFTCNFVLDFDTTLQAVLNNVANAAQASLNIVDGKYGVLIDKNKTVPVQVFTPRNSWGFTSSRSYNEAPHGLKIRYIDPVKNWDISEVVVYDNGFDENTALTFDEISTFACTNQEQAWRFGRYMLAQARLRKETISITVDFEHIVCTRGDYVQICQDVMRAGGRAARVKEIIGTNRVKIDDGIDTIGGLDYGYVYRSVTDGIKTSTLTVIDSDEFELDGQMPKVGDLIIIGEVGKIVFDCLVKAITPSSDLTATLELVEKADDIYVAESSDTLPDYDPQLTVNVDSALATPPAITDFKVVTNSWRVKGRAYEYYIGIDWDVPTGSAHDTFEVYVNNGTSYNLVAYSKDSFYEYIVNPRDLNVLHSFKVLAVSSTGKKLTLLEAPVVTATPQKKITPPSTVEFLNINITNQIIQFDWTPIPDADLDEYLIRYTPRTENATWEGSIPLLRSDKNTTVASAQGRTGTYFIKALDLNKNESLRAAIAVTSIPNLFDLNVIAETNDFPALEGELVSVEKDSDALMLKKVVTGGFEVNEYYPVGYYYYKNFLDLGEIYTARLQSLVEAEGFTVGDLMSEWNPLSSVSALARAGQADWDVETQYRTTDKFNVMADWDTLSGVDPISEGDQDNWTPWKKFTMGDATGRIFQFRLKLISHVPYASPRVFQGIIRADMPDRLESYNNLVCPPEGLDIVYSPAFKGPGNSPNIQITQDGASQGDYYSIENKSLNGFRITFYDKDHVAVTRQFDVAVKGYGRKALSVI